MITKLTYQSADRTRDALVYYVERRCWKVRLRFGGHQRTYTVATLQAAQRKARAWTAPITIGVMVISAEGAWRGCQL